MSIEQLILSKGTGLFHDFELQDIKVDYRNKQITAQLKSPSPPSTTYKLILSGAQRFQMSFLEPWGRGIYVVGTTIKSNGAGQYMEMQLNSGDSIAAVFEHIELQPN